MFIPPRAGPWDGDWEGESVMGLGSFCELSGQSCSRGRGWQTSALSWHQGPFAPLGCPLCCPMWVMRAWPGIEPVWGGRGIFGSGKI